jgi:hypothetical protein
MRISDDRYSRDRLRYDLAVRFIQHRARTQTIRLWTGLTDDRIRKLYRTYLQGDPGRIKRQRGKSPQRESFFMRSHQRKYETGALAAFLCIYGVLPANSVPGVEHTIPGVARGHLLCDAYQAYRVQLPRSSIMFEHATLLTLALARAEELQFAACEDCSALLVVDRLSLRHARCGPCRESASEHC